MSSTLGSYNPIFYAQEALIQLENALGMASRVHLGYDEERGTFNRGETINIRRPSNLTVNDAPATAEELSTETVTLTLDKWREVKFKLTDKELAFTGQRIIEEHIRPAAVALANDIDTKLMALYKSIPWYYALADSPSSTVVGDVLGPRRILFDNKAPMEEGRLHYMVNGQLEQGFLALSPFTQYQGSGPAGAEAQRRGHIGMRYGMEFFANQLVPEHTPGVSADYEGALTTATAVGDEEVIIDNVTSGGTTVVGDIIVITGDPQQYVCTADDTSTGGAATISVSPPLKQVNNIGAVVTIILSNTYQCMAFHRNAFCLVTARLNSMGNELGANVATVQDPITGLSLRSRIYYVPNSSEIHVAIDVLYAVGVLDPNLAVRCLDIL